MLNSCCTTSKKTKQTNLFLIILEKRAFDFVGTFIFNYVTLEVTILFLINNFKNISFSVSFQINSNENMRFTVVWP